MATSDLSKAVNDILSSRGKTAPETTTGTAQKTGKAPSGGLLGGLGAAVEQGSKVAGRTAGQAISGLTADLTRLPQLQNVLGDALDTSKPIEERQFNPFDRADAQGARVMASKLMEIAEGAGNDGLAVAVGVVDSFGSLLGGVGGLVPGLDNLMTAVTAGVAEVAHEIVGAVGQDVLGRAGLKEHALTLFITHYPPAHQQILVDPFDVSEPNLVSRWNSKAWPDEENRLNFWREDALLNDHHGRWHAVNPWEGRSIPPGQTNQRASHPIIGDRNGELFAYMHMQMLARYDAERLAVSLDRVEGWPSGKDKQRDYREKIPQGYKPGDRVGKKSNDGKFYLYRARPGGSSDGVQITDLAENDFGPDAIVANMKKFDEALNDAASRGYFLIPEQSDTQGSQEKIAITTDNFGNAVQASIGSVDWPDKNDITSPKNAQNYGNHHASGHVHIAWFDGQTGTKNAMVDLYATSRDPMFWRWHKHVDNIIQTWREELPPHDDLTGGTQVKIRSEDIILCGKDLPDNIDGGDFGNAAFGYDSKNSKGNPWDADFSERKVTATATLTTKEEKKEKSSGKKAEPEKVPVTVMTTTTLWTEMKNRTIHPLDIGEENKGEKDKDGKPVQQPSRKVGPPVNEIIDYLSHDDFSYFIRLENLSNDIQTVTVRIFLAPEELVQRNPRDNTTWIEMDRFLYQLDPRERAVVFRPAKMSAVIRKPAIGPTELENPELRKSDANNWCDCGWPYTLLLPRGTEAGMDFRLVVMISGDDLAMDYTGEDRTSMSHCGLQGRKYPDVRPMGYPFDRPLPDAINLIVGQNENWASRTIKIRRRS